MKEWMMPLWAVVMLHLAGYVCAQSPLPDGFSPGVGGMVFGLAMQPDGKILVGGSFTNLGGQTRRSLARLNNTEPATQSLTCDDSTITWLRGGTGPEVWRTTFEHSSDGLVWTNVGTGTRITGGWQVTNVGVPPGDNLRARGWVASGNASWFVEDYLGAPFSISQPVSQTKNAGVAVTMRVGADGTEPLSYQWVKNGAVMVDGGNVSGATTPTLTLDNVLGADEGTYSVVVVNPEGSRTSLVARLTVIDPFITPQPFSQRGRHGSGVGIDPTRRGLLPDWMTVPLSLGERDRVRGNNACVFLTRQTLAGRVELKKPSGKAGDFPS